MGPPALAQPGWAHQTAGFQSNGQVTVKSLAGGSYIGTQNPSGAVAKSNQSAATQPPTVIIQATASSYQQARPMITGGATAVPSCLAGYTSVWTSTSAVYDGIPVFNIAQTRFTFAVHSSAGSNLVGFLTDGFPTNGVASTYSVSLGGSSMTASPNSPWAANLCVK